MAVSKTTRFQVLKRDAHTCRYCGATAPEAKLAVDHVIPVALGGSDKPHNLVAACVDCNAGKGASNPGSDLVQQLSAESATHALAMVNKATVIEAQIRAEDGYLSDFNELWDSWRFTGTEAPIPKPHDYAATIARWWRQGIPLVLIEYAIKAAMNSTASDTFRYMCGVVYRRLEDADASYTFSEPQLKLYGEDELGAAFERGVRSVNAN